MTSRDYIMYKAGQASAMVKSGESGKSILDALARGGKRYGQLLRGGDLAGIMARKGFQKAHPIERKKALLAQLATALGLAGVATGAGYSLAKNKDKD